MKRKRRRKNSGISKGEREEKVETHQREGRGEESAIKRIKCSLCSQETYGAAANSKSGAESIEVCIANKEVRNTAGFWETVPDLK